MDETSLHALPRLAPAEKHNKLHSAFRTMQFQLLGSKHLIHYLIKYLVCDAEQPAHVIQDFLDKWVVHSQSEGHRRAVADSTPCDKDHTRLSKKIWRATQDLQRGKEVTQWMEECRNNWYQLSASEQSLWREYDKRELHQQLEAFKREQNAAPPKHPGVPGLHPCLATRLQLAVLYGLLTVTCNTLQCCTACLQEHLIFLL